MSSYWSSLPGVPSATTTRKTTCNLCTTPITKWYKHDPFAAQYKEGEIVALHESVHAPIDLILKEQGTSRETLEVTSGTSKGPRPAIIAGSNRAIRPSQNRPLPATTRVYLLTSYNKIHTSKLLPSILKDHFVVPVSPHCEVETSRVHLHTSPEWQDENIWVIVTKFESFGTIAGRWHYVDRRGVRQNDLSFIVAEKDMSKLHTITQARLLHWNARCAAIRDYAGQCGSVYQLFKNEGAWEQRVRDMLPHRINEISGSIIHNQSGSKAGQQPPTQDTAPHTDGSASSKPEVTMLEPSGLAGNPVPFGGLPAMQNMPAPGEQLEVE